MMAKVNRNKLYSYILQHISSVIIRHTYEKEVDLGSRLLKLRSALSYIITIFRRTRRAILIHDVKDCSSIITN